MRASITIRACAALACALSAAAVPSLAEDDLCSRPREAPDALYQRLTKTEKLPEAFRDKVYVTINDAANETIWTFTVAGHPAHPSVICREPVEEDGKLRMAMGIQCEASDDACEELARGFEGLNQKMLKELERQKK